MKKVLALLLAIMMVLTLVACGDKKDAEEKVEEAVSNMEEALGDLESALSGNQEDMQDALDQATSALDQYTSAVQDADIPQPSGTLETYVAELKASADFQQNADQFQSQGLLYDIEARGSKLVYLYTYMVEVDTQAVAAGFDDSMGSMMESLLPALKTEVPSMEACVVEFYDVAGNLILSREYK
ncbi:MAG: hypothetical protein IKT68_06005 [Clostridia bacterium]|nr:hypothetical protein [Clostridia bacterium]